MITAILIGALVLAFALWAAADRLGTIVTEAIAEAVQAVCEEVSDAVKKVDYPSRMIQAKEGTRLARVCETEDGLEIAYTPVLAFVEGAQGERWSPLTLRRGDSSASALSSFRYPAASVVSARVLLPGDSLSDEECLEMKKEYREQVELDKELARHKDVES